MVQMVRVLIVDDEPPSAGMIEKLLLKYFPMITVSAIASNVKEALQHLEEQVIDLVFLDIELKGQSGFDLLDHSPDRNWQFITLSASKEFAFKTFEYGGSGYLLKP
jgi:response regulator of citrate/malate metabolism